MITSVKIDPTFTNRIADWAEAAGKEIGEAFRIQGRLLAHELIQRTPPFSGKAIVRMLSARKDGAKLKDTDVESLNARKVGIRRVELDVKKVIYGMRGSEPDAAQVYLGQNQHKVYSRAAIKDWGVFQRCEGKPAVRIFATKGGTVYGVDEANFNPNADARTIGKYHYAARGKRGRVSTAGTAKEKVVGRWRWMNVLITSEKAIRAYITKKQRNVGRAKGGWANAYMALGGRMSKNGWVGRHAGKVGDNKIDLRPYNAEITLINKSEWASGGDDLRIIPQAIAGRDKALCGDIARILKEKWGK